MYSKGIQIRDLDELFSSSVLCVSFGEDCCPLYSGEALASSQATEKDIRDLCNELNLLAMVGEHHNIVGLIGACSVEGPLWLVVKFAAHGSLLEFLKKFKQTEYENARDQNKVETLSERDKLKIAFEIASGMAHLFKKKCVHRDLAARNVLLDADNTAMVADFGLSRDVYERGEYKTTSGGMLPVRWMAPESLEEFTYTMQSDVWSFGVLLWEVETAGRMPYAGMSGTEIVERISRGYRLPKPEGCTQVMYNIMTDCWQHNPNERPAFKDLVERLEKLLFKTAEYLEVVAMETKAQSRENEYDPIIIKERTMSEGTERGDDGQGLRLLLPNEENKHKLGSGMSPQEAQDKTRENGHEATEMKERR